MDEEKKLRDFIEHEKFNFEIVQSEFNQKRNEIYNINSIIYSIGIGFFAICIATASLFQLTFLVYLGTVTFILLLCISRYREEKTKKRIEKSGDAMKVSANKIDRWYKELEKYY